MHDMKLEQFAATGLKLPNVAFADGYFTSDDARIYFAQFGVGPPVILLHGGMGNSTNWANQIEALVDNGFSAIVLDTRGHGRSTNGNQRFSYALFAQDLYRLSSHLQLNKMLLVGWSDGACTALEFARQYPPRTAGIIFFACNVDSSGTKEFQMSETIGNCLQRHKSDYERLTPSTDAFDELQPKLDPMQQNEPNYSAADLAAIDVPIAVIQAQHDEFIQEEHAKYIADNLPNSHFDILHDVSHFAPIQDPGQFNQVMLKHLNKMMPHS